MFHHKWMGRSQGLVRRDGCPIFFRMQLGMVAPEERESLIVLWHRINFLCVPESRTQVFLTLARNGQMKGSVS